MNSFPNLTRAVFRALVSNRPYFAPGCQRRTYRSQNVSKVQRLPHHVQRRGFFGLSMPGQTSTLADARGTSGNLELALSRMVGLVRARRAQSRLPPDKETLEAFKFLFRSRLENPKPLTRNEIFLSTEVFIHLKERGLIRESGAKDVLSKEDLHNILLTLAIAPGIDRFRTDTKTLATYVFNALQHPEASLAPDGGLEKHEISEVVTSDDVMFPTYVQVLSRTGSALEALDLLKQNPVQNGEQGNALWISVLKGLASERRDKEFWQVFEKLQESSGGVTVDMQEEFVSYFAANSDLSNLQKMLQAQVRGDEVPSTSTLMRAADFYIENRHHELAKAVIQQLQKRDDNAKISTILLWEIAQHPSISRLRKTVQSLLQSGQSAAIDMSVFNRLIQYLFSHDHPREAMECIKLAESFALRPNATTHALQLNFALDRQDLAAASTIFDMLSMEDAPSDRSDVKALNRYMAALSFSSGPDNETLMRVVDRCLDNGIELETEAVAGLCHTFLYQDRLDDVMGILKHRVDSYPLPDRARVAAVFRDFIVNPSVQDQKAYNAYDILRHVFPETEVEHRLPLMHSFFDRHRPDLGCLVFGHMRQREELPARPTPEAYAQCFEGIARCKDIDGLQMVYNMLKLDQEVEQTTRIHNGLMQAYTACQLPFTAIIDHFWKILDSREGPSFNSFALALRACETWVPQGSQEARKIIALMQHWKLPITKEIYHCYIGAIAGNSEFENAVELIETMHEDIGESPDAITIGTLYNSIPWQYRKDAVEEWAKKVYPEQWQDLMTFGDEIDEEWEIRYFKIDRSIDVDDEPLFGEGEYEPQIVKMTFAAIEE